MAELKKQFKTTIISAIILIVLHLRMGYVQPLFLQSILPIKNLYYSPLTQVFLFGKGDSGFRRPWISNPFG